MLASAGADGNAKVTDFKTGKVFLTGEVSGEGNLGFVEMDSSDIIFRICQICVFCLGSERSRRCKSSVECLRSRLKHRIYI